VRKGAGARPSVSHRSHSPAPKAHYTGSRTRLQLAPGGRLHKASLVSYDEPDDEMCDRSIVVDALLVELLLSGKARVEGVWDVTTEEELRQELRALTCAFRRKAKAMDWVESGFPPGARVELYRASRLLRRQLGQLIRTLELHAHWKLARWIPPGSSPRLLREPAAACGDHSAAASPSPGSPPFVRRGPGPPLPARLHVTSGVWVL